MKINKTSDTKLASIFPRLSMIHASLVVAFMTTCVGLCQISLDIFVARKFGTGKEIDSFYLAFVLPSMLVNVLAGGTIIGAFLPAYVQTLTGSGEAPARQLLGETIFILFVWLLTTVVLLSASYPILWEFANTQYAIHARKLTIELSLTLLWFLLFSGLSTLLCATLVARKRYVLSSLAPALIPATALIFLVYARNEVEIQMLAKGLVAGAAIQFLILAATLVRGRLIQLSLRPLDLSRTRSLLAGYLWMMGTAGLLAGITLVDQATAGSLALGSVARLNFAVKLVNMFLAFLTVVVANTSLPYFSRMVLVSDWRLLWKELRIILGVIFGLGVIASVVWILFSEQVVHLVYERGAFSHSDSVAVARIQSYYALHIPFYMLGVVGIRMLNAIQRNDILILVAAFAFVTNIIINKLLVPTMGVEGIVLGKTAVYAFLTGSIILFLRKILTTKNCEENSSA